MDLTCSSHPILINNELQSVEVAAKETLKREWNFKSGQKLTVKGPIYYKAKDVISGFTEHELCYLVLGRVTRLPHPNPEFSYGSSLLTKKQITEKPITEILAPWVRKLLPLLD